MKALITGASSGIGRSFVYFLSNMGYELILVSRDENKLKDVAKDLKTKVDIIPMDLSEEKNCFKLYEQLKEKDIDFVINNAGYGLFGNTWETDMDTELKMINLNIKAVHILTKLFLQDMIKKDKGRILNVASSAGFLAGPKLNTYYATKNYVAKWTMGIYEELRRIKSNVKISVLCPGPVDTNFNKVAGGEFKIDALSSDEVARYALKKCFKNKLIIVPGITVKMGLFFNRFISHKLSLKVVYNIQDKKIRRSKNV